VGDDVGENTAVAVAFALDVAVPEALCVGVSVAVAACVHISSLPARL
jgi:hydrogenase-4 membrane subunit HyfE